MVLKVRDRMEFWVSQVVFDRNVEVIDPLDLAGLHLCKYCFSICRGFNVISDELFRLQLLLYEASL